MDYILIKTKSNNPSCIGCAFCKADGRSIVFKCQHNNYATKACVDNSKSIFDQPNKIYIKNPNKHIDIL